MAKFLSLVGVSCNVLILYTKARDPVVATWKMNWKEHTLSMSCLKTQRGSGFLSGTAYFFMVICIAWSGKRHWSRSRWLSIHFIFNLSYLKIILTEVILKQWAGKHGTDIESGGQSAPTNSPVDSFRSNSNLRHKTGERECSRPRRSLFWLASCVWLFVTLWPTRLSVHGISQARILEWVAKPSSRGSSQPWDQTRISCVDRQTIYRWATGEARICSSVMISAGQNRFMCIDELKRKSRNTAVDTPECYHTKMPVVFWNGTAHSSVEILS